MGEMGDIKELLVHSNAKVPWLGLKVWEWVFIALSSTFGLWVILHFSCKLVHGCSWVVFFAWFQQAELWRSKSHIPFLCYLSVPFSLSWWCIQIYNYFKTSWILLVSTLLDKGYTQNYLWEEASSTLWTLRNNTTLLIFLEVLFSWKSGYIPALFRGLLLDWIVHWGNISQG